MNEVITIDVEKLSYTLNQAVGVLMAFLGVVLLYLLVSHKIDPYRKDRPYKYRREELESKDDDDKSE